MLCCCRAAQALTYFQLHACQQASQYTNPDVCSAADKQSSSRIPFLSLEWDSFFRLLTVTKHAETKWSLKLLSFSKICKLVVRVQAAEGEISQTDYLSLMSLGNHTKMQFHIFKIIKILLTFLYVSKQRTSKAMTREFSLREGSK